ncbi:hypothetical protein ACHAW5_009670 [Stephanodiscus triporus]|uniref:Peptidase S33 tripeptidyl aminopeptidase-like C-terminal domain-containing protein n=1 Tax=Stephanodiscus triporus TaxID=2934178 RepID=A0ABD3N3E4_9STRA
MSDLVLYGTIYDPDVVYPRRPLFDVSASSTSTYSAPEVANTAEASLEDFTIPGTITREAALAFSSLAMTCDPIKAAWDDLHEFNECDPSRVAVPTLIISGAKDPYVNWSAQLALLRGLGTEDKAMYCVPNSDHAAHVLEERDAFVGAVAGFLSRRDGIRALLREVGGG